MGDLIHRFRYPLTYLALALFSTLSLASPQPPTRETGIASRWMIGFTGPVEEMVSLPFREVGNLWSSYVDLVGEKREKEELHAELARQAKQILELQEALEDSERYERFREFSTRQDVPMVAANVAGVDLSPWSKSILIRKGASDGIKPGMPVLTDYGAVGLVSGVSSNYSRVLLVTDPQSLVDAFSQRTRVRGTVQGGGDGPSELRDVGREQDVKIGDKLLTSGLGGIYPKGVLVGTVTGVERKPYGLFQSVQVEPAVDFTRLEEVFVILERRELPDSDSFSTESDDLWAAPPGQAEPETAPGSPE